MRACSKRSGLLDILKNFILLQSVDGSQTAFEDSGGVSPVFRGAQRRLRTSEASPPRPTAKGGVFWHTQGSGKSLSMVFYAHLLQEALDSPTIVVMTDRIDLDDQLYGTVLPSVLHFLRQTPLQAREQGAFEGAVGGPHRLTASSSPPCSEVRASRRAAVGAPESLWSWRTRPTAGSMALTEKIVTRRRMRRANWRRESSVGNARIIRDSPAERHLYRLYRHARLRQRPQHPRGVRRLYRHLRHDAGCGGRRHPPGLLRKPGDPPEARPEHAGADRLVPMTCWSSRPTPLSIEKSKKMLGQMESRSGRGL